MLFGRSFRGGCFALLGGSFWLSASLVGAVEVPPGPLANLASEDFRTRELAQTELLVWARNSQEPVMDELFKLSRTAGEPEVRERCLAILRELVIDEYLKEGEGYIGIRMQEEIGQVPGDPKPRALIRVIEVVADSAAEKAGLRLNDLIAGLNGQIWRDNTATLVFMEKVRQFKPKTRIQLTILRDGKLEEVDVILGRRPLIPDNPFFDDRQFDLEAVERVARENYFRRWLENKKAGG